MGNRNLPDKTIIDFANRLADASGEILRAAYRQPIAAIRKSDASPVTAADREVESTLRTLIEAQYPDHGIVGEEFGVARPDARYKWVLDPIDGTRSFIAGYPLFTTLISLVCDGVPVLGIIDQAILRERWVGVEGKVDPGLRRDDKKKLGSAVIATTSIDYFTPVQLETFQKLKSQCANTVLGGDAYAYAMLASGQIDIVVDAGLKPYDFCALKPVIEGAGGVITDWSGAPLTLASDGRVIAAANATLHKAALALLG